MHEDIGLEAAKWRTMDSALRSKVEEYETWRKAWHSAQTSGEATHARAKMEDAACSVAGYLSLALGVEATS